METNEQAATRGNTALVKTNVAQLVAKPTTAKAMVMAEALAEAKEQRQLLGQFVNDQMIPGVDFGVIPGTAKPTLLKPGAEKLTELFRCTPSYELLEKREDWETGDCSYMFRVKIISREGDTCLAEGYGSANSKEGRYRWRNTGRKCPKCKKEKIGPGKKEYGGGFVCYTKNGGCGAKFSGNDPAILEQEIGRVPNDDTYTLWNTILKMAKKRALVDATIGLARCSDKFTQDIEDLAESGHGDPEEVVVQRESKKKTAENVAAIELGQARMGLVQKYKNAGKELKDMKAWSTGILGKEKTKEELTLEDIKRLEQELVEDIDY